MTFKINKTNYRIITCMFLSFCTVNEKLIGKDVIGIGRGLL
jgi:hypothetical protein